MELLGNNIYIIVASSLGIVILVSIAIFVVRKIQRNKTAWPLVEIETIRLEDITSWFLQHKEYKQEPNNQVIACTLLQTHKEHKVELLQGFLDQQTNQFIFARRIHSQQLSDELMQMHSEHGLVVYD